MLAKYRGLPPSLAYKIFLCPVRAALEYVTSMQNQQSVPLTTYPKSRFGKWGTTDEHEIYTDDFGFIYPLLQEVY